MVVRKTSGESHTRSQDVAPPVEIQLDCCACVGARGNESSCRAYRTSITIKNSRHSKADPDLINETIPMPAQDYTLTLDLNVLNHLGINLYSNVPATLL